MDKHPASELMETVMGKIKEMTDISTVIGEPIVTADGITIIPVSKVSFGFASGGSDFTGKNQQAGQQNPFGGGSGAGVKIVPSVFIVVKDGNVRLLNVEAPPANTLDRLIDSAPELIDKVYGMIKKDDVPAEQA